MGMRKTREISQASDKQLRARLEAGDTKSVQLAPSTTKQRNQVARLGFGKAGRGQG